jgi:hypothetical protein
MHRLTLFLFLAVGCCAPTLSFAAITSPYSNLFFDPSSVSNHTATQATQWSVLPAGKYQNEILANAPNKSSSSMVFFNDLGGSPFTAKDFSLSTTFTITNSINDFNSLGFAVLANNPDATTNTNPFYLADLFIGGGSNNAQLRFAEISTDPTPGLATTMLNLQKILQLNIPYSLQLTGNYESDGDLNLTLELSGDNDFDSFQAHINNADVLTGNYFGYRDRASGGANSALTVEYDSLNISAIPEPSSIGFVAASLIGGYALGRYWRRRQAKINS